MGTVDMVRIDGGVRAKLACGDCGAETYVPMIADGPRPVEDVSRDLDKAASSHRLTCPMR